MKTSVRIPRDKFARIYICIYCVYSFAMTLDSSLLPIATIMKVIRYGTMAGLMLLFAIGCYNKGFSIKKMIIATMIVIAFSISAVITNRSRLMVFAMLIIVAPLLTFNVDHLVRVFCLSVVSSLIVLIVFCKMKIINDYIYTSGAREAHCLGFSYYTAFPYRVFLCTLMYLFLRKGKISLLECAFLLLINHIMYKLTTTRLTYALSIFAIVLDYIVMKWHKFDLNTRLKRFLAIISFPVGIGITVYSLVEYSPGNKLWLKLNSVLSNRLSLAHDGYVNHGIKLFGNLVEMEGNSVLRETTDYFYIDSGFAYSLIGYGILFTIVSVLMYTILFYYSCQTNNKALFVWIISIWVFSFVNNVWVSVDMNPIMVLTLIALIQIRTRKRNRYYEGFKVLCNQV